LEEVSASAGEQFVVPGEAAHDVCARRSDEPVAPRRAGDAPSAGRSDSDQQADEHECENAHRLSVTSAVTPGLYDADYDPVS